jgi:hypothetical protein
MLMPAAPSCEPDGADHAGPVLVAQQEDVRLGIELDLDAVETDDARTAMQGRLDLADTIRAFDSHAQQAVEAVAIAADGLRDDEPARGGFLQSVDGRDAAPNARPAASRPAGRVSGPCVERVGADRHRSR